MTTINNNNLKDLIAIKSDIRDIIFNYINAPLNKYTESLLKSDITTYLNQTKLSNKIQDYNYDIHGDVYTNTLIMKLYIQPVCAIERIQFKVDITNIERPIIINYNNSIFSINNNGCTVKTKEDEMIYTHFELLEIIKQFPEEIQSQFERALYERL